VSGRPPAVDPSRFATSNVLDTCAVWNVLASATLYRVAREWRCLFAITDFVRYECLVKPRRTEDSNSIELRRRLGVQLEARAISVFPVEIADLQVPEIQHERMRMGKGELSALAFTLKTRQALMTDDQHARLIAHQVLPPPGAQTTPHLLGWLVFILALGDSDAHTVIREHEALGRPLRPHFETVLARALEYRLRSRGLSS